MPVLCDDPIPDASIDGVDVNARTIRIARRAARRYRSAAIRFRCQATPSGQAASYDVIVCLSVFRHAALNRDRPDRCAAIIPFSRFDDMLAALDMVLAPGGLLCLWNANFQFADASIANRYIPIAVADMPVQHVALYGPDDRRFANG